MESDIKGLLDKWSRFEPHLCKQETRPNKDWHEEFEDYYIKDNQLGWQIVYFDGHNNLSDIIKKEAPAKIQWAVQQAIIEKGWYFTISATDKDYGFLIAVQRKLHKPKIIESKDMVKALLSAYLAELEASANP